MKNYNFSEISARFSFSNFNNLEKFSLPEFCFAGRSNVGKSSIINSLLNKKKIATTSNKPGHTKKIFFYKISRSFLIVDLPGYGFANTSKKKTDQISNLLFLYLTNREFLKRIFVLIDSRHGIKNIDKEFIDFLEKYYLNYQIVLTKIDKLPSKSLEDLMHNMKNLYDKSANKIIFSSSKTKLGIKEIRKQIINIIKSE